MTAPEPRANPLLIGHDAAEAMLADAAATDAACFLFVFQLGGMTGLELLEHLRARGVRGLGRHHGQGLGVVAQVERVLHDVVGERVLSQGFLVEGATFCPNGRVLMFYRQTPLASGHSSRLVMIGVDGFNERLVDTPTYATDPSWGPLLS